MGGFAVILHGCPRTTADIDVWIAMNRANGALVLGVLREFGFPTDQLDPALLGKPDQIIRMGVPPVRIELLTTIDGVEFAACYRRRTTGRLDDVQVPLISLEDLKRNKLASGRAKDLADLEQLSRIRPL